MSHADRQLSGQQAGDGSIFDEFGGTDDAAPLQSADSGQSASGTTAAATGAAGTTTETVTYPGSGLVFVNTYSASVSQSYKSAIKAAENFYQSNITTSVTLDFSFDTKNGGSSGFVAENEWYYVNVSYSTLKNALTSHATSADDKAAVASLPANDITGGKGFAVPTSLARALGLLPSTSSSTDDTVYLNSADTYFYDQSTPVAGAFDATSAIEHEISEGMGRVGGLGLPANNVWGILDLYRYSASGSRDLTGGQDGKNAYFSIDGSTLLTQFHNPISTNGANDGDDSGDWEITGDSYGFAVAGQVSPVSATDLRLMDVIGWTPTTGATVADDYRNTYNDTSLPLGSAAVATSVTGSIDYVGDKDVFAVSLTAGNHYTFYMDGTRVDHNTLADPYLRLLDGTGKQLAVDDDVSSTDWGSQIGYTPLSSGTYYLEASSSPSDTIYTTGTYRIYTAVVQDDYRNTYTDTSLPLGSAAVATSVPGSIDYVGDKDVFAVSLTAGNHYTFYMDGTRVDHNTLADPYLRLLDGTGKQLAVDDDVSSTDWGSQIGYTPLSSGTYYLEASSSPSDTIYTTGTYRIYTAVVQDDYRNTYTDTSLPLGSAAVATSVPGSIDYVGDKDVFAVSLTAGNHYTFYMDGTRVDHNTLADPYLRLLDGSGTQLAADDDVSSSDWGSQIDYTPASGGTYYLEASSSPSDTIYTTGTYRIYTKATQTGSASASSGSGASSGQPSALEGGAADPVIIAVASGDRSLTAGANPEVFDFSSVSFGNDAIVGFDPTRDVLRLGALAGSFAAVQSDMTATAGGTLIALDSSRSITLNGIDPASLTAANFRFA